MDEAQRRRALFIAGILAVLILLAVPLVPVGPTTPASVRLAPEPIPLTAGHPLEVSSRGRTTVLGRANRGVSTIGAVSRRETGLWLAPKSQGTIILKLRPPVVREQETVAYVSASAYGPVVTTFTVAGRSGQPRDVGPASWSGLAQRLDVTPEAATGLVQLTIHSTNAANEPVLMASRVVAVVEPAVSWPSTLIVVLWGTLACAGALAIVLLLRVPPVIAALLVGALALGAFLRIRHLVEMASTQLGPDSTFYRYLADGMRHPYDTASREPLWPLIDRIWFTVVGSSDMSLRVLTLVLSVTLIAVMYAFAARATRSRVAGLAAATLLAVHSAFISSGALGLREELYALLLVLTVHVALLMAEWSPTRRLFALAGLVSALALLRLSTLYFVPLLLLLGLRRGLQLRHVIVPLACAATLLAPYLVYSQQRFGDALWASNMHAVYYRNFEFVLVEEKTCDGCPTLPQMLASGSYAGTSITPADYVFGMHSGATVVTDTATGLYHLLLRPGAPLEILLGRPPVIVAYFAGLVVALALARGREMLFVVLVGINLIAFLEPIGLDLRLVYHVVPFMLVIAVLPIAVALDWLTGEAKRRWRGAKSDDGRL